MTMTTVATCAFEGSFDVALNIKRHHAYIDEARERGVDLLVFPEISLQGYPDYNDTVTPEALRAAWDSAESVQDGPSARAVIDYAAAAGIHVVFGMHERGDGPGEIYNTAVLVGPDGVIGTYRKVHLGHLERMFWQHGSAWPVFDTPFGRIGMLICVDKAWPEASRELALGGADLLVMPTAWPFVVGGSPEKDPVWAEYYFLFERARAAENSRWFIGSNFVGPLGKSHYPGYSQIIDPVGRVRASSEDRPGLVIEQIDIRGEIEAAQAYWGGPRFVRERMAHTYTLGRSPTDLN
jgi:predicted amidohydrolase